jgi:hypothetical protein
MTDLHDRFGAWLTDGARADLPRDAALHAAACDECRRDTAAFDALLAIDPGAASLPPVTAGRGSRAVAPPVRIIRAAAAVVAVLLLAVSVGIGAGSLLGGARSGAGSTLGSPTPRGEGVLGNAGGPQSTDSADPRESSSVRPTESPATSAEPSGAPAAATPPPAFPTFRPVVTPGPTAVTPPIGTPPPSATSAATPAPTALPSGPPSPTLVATPEPPPTEVPTPAPTPAPDDCEDGLDNDGDFLIDILDPGCLLTGDEASA